jgi:hypothetical protein
MRRLQHGEKRSFSRNAGLGGKLAPMRKSFDSNPLEILVQASLAPAPKRERGAYPAM